MPSNDEHTDEFAVIEELTAYLDGELDSDQQRVVESRLGTDASYLAEMQSLQKTWDVLDELPRTEPDNSFTKTTMELIVGEVKKQSANNRVSRVWPLRILLSLAICAGLFGVSFGYLRMTQTHPDRILIEHLPAIENQERYKEAVGYDFDFLQQIANSNLFPRTAGTPFELDIDADKLTFAIPDDEESRLTWINSLDIDKKEKLTTKLKKFLSLEDTPKEKLLAFDKQLSQHTDHEKLLFTLNAYYEWLKSVAPEEKNRLRDAKVDERLKMISKIRSDQARAKFIALASELPEKADRPVVFHWFAGLLKVNESRIRAHFPSAVAQYKRENPRSFKQVSRRSRSILRLSPEDIKTFAAKGKLYFLVDQLMVIDPDFIETITMDDDNIAFLTQLISEKAQAILLNRSESAQRQLIRSWVDIAIRPNDVSEKELKRFAQTLPQKDRDAMNKLSSEQFKDQLRKMYLDNNKRRSPDWRELYESFRVKPNGSSQDN